MIVPSPEDAVADAERPPDDDDRVPVFGTWTRIYAAVLINLLVMMGLLLAFARWPY
jgi:hypothetical protein